MDNLKFVNKKHVIFMLICLVGSLFFYWILGFTAVKVFLGLFFIFFLPFYIIMSRFCLEDEEKLIFSFIIGICFFSVIAYYIAFLVGSLKISILISVIIMYSIAILLNYSKIVKYLKQKE